MGEFSREVSHLVRIAARKASEQGGIISGANPAAYNVSDPFPLWVIQAIIIIAMTQFLSVIFSRIRQPRVIAEIIGGIILGPSIFGRIPKFQNAVFPAASLTNLNLSSTIGLVLFLFLVGLEIDTKVIKRNVVAATSVSVAGLIIPLGMGAAIGVALYHEFAGPHINYGYFILFTAVAVGITAFPVLCRILTELKLLDTNVGVITLSAGVGNDVVGWILLALTVALVNASTGLTALYVLLAATGFVIFFMYPVRWGYHWLARYTGSLEQGSPTTGMMTVTILLILAAAFFTDIIGIHAVFGGFLSGLIIPHDNGYAISIVEKLEDLVTILLLPIYFALSGLRTNLGSMNSGKTWGYTIVLCLVSFSSKFFSCFATASANKFNWREAGAIGALMSCKGLVELIVLNIGLQAGILDTRTFSMFVVHAVVLTFITTPLTLFFYPPQHRTRHDKLHTTEAGSGPISSTDEEIKSRFALVLEKIEQLPAAMMISQLLHSNKTTISKEGNTDAEPQDLISSPYVAINALRLIELTNRTSAVLKSQVAASLAQSDPVISVFRTFGYLNRLVVSAALSVVSHDQFASAIVNHVEESNSQVVILPWSWPRATTSSEEEHTGSPFDKSTAQDQTGSIVYSEFVRSVFASSPTHVALFIDRGVNASHPGASTRFGTNQHIFLPFFGGPDDRLALSFLVQLCQNSSVRATVVRMQKLDSSPADSEDEKDIKELEIAHLPVLAPYTISAVDTVYGRNNTQTRVASDTADNIMWNKYTSPQSSHNANTTLALSRVTFNTSSSSAPLHSIIDLVPKESSPLMPVIVIAGRSRRMAVESHGDELRQIISEKGSTVGSSVPKTLGYVGAALVAANATASLLILQASLS